MKTLKLLTYLFIVIFLYGCDEAREDEVLPVALGEMSASSDDSSPLGQHHHHPRKKKFLLVHGAWHPEGSWSRIVLGLEANGHEARTVQLPGLGTDRTPLDQVTLGTHVSAVMDKMREMGPGITLVGHSYGGVVVSQAAQNLASYIKKVVYVSAFMLKDGESLLDVASQDTESVVTQNAIVAGEGIFLPRNTWDNAFYNAVYHCSNIRKKEEVYFLKTLLVPHPYVTFNTPVHLGCAYNRLEKVYVSCLDDHAITPSAQWRMYHRFPGVKVFKIFNADHSPFVSTPTILTNILQGL